MVEPVANATGLNAVSCPSTTECVTVDQTGDESTGTTGGPPPAVPMSTTPPAISGTATQAQTLTETHGTWTNSPTGYAYQWEDCDSSGNSCSAITGATGQTYALTATDVGHTIRVQETATNAAGPSAPATSAASGVVAAASTSTPPPPPPSKPANTSPPVVSGTLTAGQTLSATTGIWSGTTPLSYSYQWARCASSCSPITDAISTTYTLTKADVGAKIAVTVTATNSAGSTSAASSQIGPVVAAVVGPSFAQITAALSTILKPSGKTATTKAILKAGGFAFSFSAPSGGKLVIDWFATVGGKQVLVASATATFHQAGEATVKLKLTSKGRKLLKHTKTRKITTKATFTPTGGAATTSTRGSTLKR